jgi:hypothetical protein
MHRKARLQLAMHGGILLTTLVIAVVIATILAGMGTLIVSYYSRVSTEAVYANSINLADAGVNYELHRINANVYDADLPTSGSPPGATVALAAGTFRVYCTMTDGLTAWDKQTVPFCIFSTGTIGNVTRTVEIVATDVTSGGSYAVFGIQSGLVAAAPSIVSGNLGTNGVLSFTGTPIIAGSVMFDGSAANWLAPPDASYNVTYNASAVSWPSVETIATKAFGTSGLGYVALHNDNSLGTPPITNPSLTVSAGTQTFDGKPGGANYYLTSLTCNAGATIAFNNAAGPITIWVGPSGISSSFVFYGGSALVKSAIDPTKPVRIYSATSNDVVQNGNVELDAGIYNVNNAGVGRVVLNGSGNMYTSIISNMFTFNGAPTVHFITGYFSPTGQGVYSFSNNWQELNGL